MLNSFYMIENLYCDPRTSLLLAVAIGAQRRSFPARVAARESQEGRSAAQSAQRHVVIKRECGPRFAHPLSATRLYIHVHVCVYLCVAAREAGHARFEVRDADEFWQHDARPLWDAQTPVKTRHW